MSERALERSSVIYVPPARRSVRKARMPFFMKKWRRERPACRRSPSRNVGRENTVLRVKVQVCRLPAASCAGKRPRMDKRRVAPFREKFSSGPPASCTGGTPPLFRNAVSFPSCRLQGETCLRLQAASTDGAPHGDIFLKSLLLQTRLRSFRGTKKPACPQTPADRLVQLRKRRGGYGVTPAVSGIRGC